MIETPIFLVGAERSGTTLLRLMLDHHPLLAFHYEFEFAVDQMDQYGNYPKLSDYYEYLAYHRIFLDTGCTIDQQLDYPTLVNSFLLQKQRRSHKPLIGATVHHRFDQLLKIWPKAKFIHLLRDGRDVAHSAMVMGWYGNLFAATDLWIEAEQLWQKLSTQIPPDRHITICYEKLVQNSDEVLTQICNFIGIPFDKTMYDYAKHSTYELPNPKLGQQWRKKLTPRQIQLAECKIAQMLTERGYELSGLPLIAVTPWLRWQLSLQNRWAKNIFRLRRYSLGLYLAEILSRRLHLQSWQKQVRCRINELEKKHLK